MGDDHGRQAHRWRENLRMHKSTFFSYAMNWESTYKDKTPLGDNQYHRGKSGNNYLGLEREWNTEPIQNCLALEEQQLVPL